MFKGLWKVAFNSDIFSGYGVIVFNGERILGGDSSYCYMGNYKVDNSGRIKADMKIQDHSNVLDSIFGKMSQFNLKLEGTSNKLDRFELDGYMIEDSTKKVHVKATKLSD